MKLSDLKNGMLCVTRNGDTYIVMENCPLVVGGHEEVGTMLLGVGVTTGFLYVTESRYHKDLTSKRFEDFDIMYVSIPTRFHRYMLDPGYRLRDTDENCVFARTSLVMPERGLHRLIDEVIRANS